LIYYNKASRNRGFPGVISWKEVDEGWIRYDQRSGSTLLLAPLARFVIDFIDGNPGRISFSEIVDEVLLAEPDADPAVCHLEVESVLRILSEAQLIQNVQP
jgi:hypothetical protein